ncbi:hypothetical protein I4F81_009719 [Pyropia yezoensis]|uniref:Uncharacterized protein n=1 Tax=Pyropia yezoensis TaxID=2788 RepID=A0ACC3CAL0_PYRYE|nr:hypothetical protein I4F81_009719 [Neopyropia yezoensis]
MASFQERRAMAAVVAHLTAAAAAGGPPAAADLGSAADALSRAYDLGAEPPAAADAPSFLTVWEAGTTALGVAPAAATSAVGDANGGAAPTDADIAAAEELKAQGNDALLRKDYPEAERLYTAALARRPGTAVYLSNRAAAKIYQASFVDALDDCKAAIEAEPGFVRAHERLASAYRHLGMVDEEVAALQDAAALDPASTKIASALASAVARSTGEGPAGNSSVGSRGVVMLAAACPTSVPFSPTPLWLV